MMRIQETRAAWLLAGLSMLVGVGIVTAPSLWSIIVGVVVLGVLSATTASREWQLPTALMVLLIVPFDNMAFLTGPVRAGAALGVVVALGLPHLLPGGARRISRSVRASHVLWALALAAVLLLHRDDAVLRVGSVWLLASLVYLWLGAECVDRDVLSRVVRVVAIAGGVQGAFAIINQLVGGALADAIPVYEPFVRTFGDTLGSRATGLAGHPLRLGTLCMLSAVACTSLASDGGSVRERLRWTAIGIVSAAALVLSGARGSWVGAVVGIVVLALPKLVQGGVLRRPAPLVALLGIVAGVWVVLQDFVIARVFSASTVASDSTLHRLNVLATVLRMEGFVVLYGVGFGGYQETLYSRGLLSVAVENEYVLAFLAGGLVLAVPLIYLTLDTFGLVVRAMVSGRHSVFAGLAIALLINMGTYNLLSWTIGPLLLSAVIGSLDAEDRHARSSGR